MESAIRCVQVQQQGLLQSLKGGNSQQLIYSSTVHLIDLQRTRALQTCWRGLKGTTIWFVRVGLATASLRGHWPILHQTCTKASTQRSKQMRKEMQQELEQRRCRKRHSQMQPSELCVFKTKGHHTIQENFVNLSHSRLTFELFFWYTHSLQMLQWATRHRYRFLTFM